MSGELQDLMLVLGIEAAVSTRQLTSYWSLQLRHADGVRWVDVAHFVSRDEAEDAHARIAVAGGDVDLRVTLVRRDS